MAFEPCAVNIRSGDVIIHGNEPMFVLNTKYSGGSVKSATVRLQLKSLPNNSETEVVFQALEKIIILKRRKGIYLGFDGSMYLFDFDDGQGVCMVEAEYMDNALKNCLEKGMVLDVELYDGKPIYFHLPTSVVQ